MLCSPILLLLLLLLWLGGLLRLLLGWRLSLRVVERVLCLMVLLGRWRRCLLLGLLDLLGLLFFLVHVAEEAERAKLNAHALQSGLGSGRASGDDDGCLLLHPGDGPLGQTWRKERLLGSSGRLSGRCQ